MGNPAEQTGIANLAHWIGGKPEAGNGQRSSVVYNPATGQVSGQVALGGAGDIDAAVQAATSAFSAWSNTPPVRRARVMFRFLELLNTHKDELARAITKEHGKVFTDAQ